MTKEKPDTQLVLMDINDLIGADWNYKTDGTEEEIEKLINSIKEDGSAGVLAVREIKKDGKPLFEVIDGNHRLVAVKRMGWKKVPCENFGELSKAKAILVARRRNTSWFKDDIFKLQDLFNTEVFPEYSIDDLLNFMPESRGFLESLQSIGELPWEKAQDSIEKKSLEETQKDEGFVDFQIKVPQETMAVWERLKKRYSDALGEQPDYRVFEFALIEALNVPEEKLNESYSD